jgi:hypothetical protein
MIDESDFKVWQEQKMTRMFFKFIKNGSEDIKDFVVKCRDFTIEGSVKENYLKGLIDAYTKCLSISLEEIKSVEEEDK